MKLSELFPGLKYIIIVGCGILLLTGSQITTGWEIIDFCQNHISAQRYLAGFPIYTPIHCLNVPMISDIQYPAHPPFSIFLFLPFAHLSLSLASQIWLYLSVGLYYASGLLLLKDLKKLSALPVFIFTIISLFWQPFVLANSVHNLIHLLLFLIVLAYSFFRRHHPAASGLLLGLAALIKVWPGLLVLTALFCKQTKLFWSAVITYLVGNLLSLLVFGPTEHWVYLTRVLQNEHFFYPDPANLSIPGLITRFITGFPAHRLAALFPNIPFQTSTLLGDITAVILLIVFIFNIHRISRLGRHKFDDLIIFGLGTILTYLVFPITWNWGLVILLLPATIGARYFRTFHHLPFWWFTLLALSSIVIIYPNWTLPYQLFHLPITNLKFNTLLSAWVTVDLIILFTVFVSYLYFITKSSSTPTPRPSDTSE